MRPKESQDFKNFFEAKEARKENAAQHQKPNAPPATT